MRPLKILSSVSLALLLAGCAASVSETARSIDPPIIPPVPSDVLACRHDPVDVPDRDLEVGEIERLWKIDRDSLGRVSACYGRLVCQYQDVRAGLGRVETKTCSDGGKRRGGRQ
jgi:hypothetical protein